ncbi:hypothetical protein [Mailhella sp.]|uniref:hypothetical protein n=1 Tax=Mailhella sp. TaxID=1981029 RepID=UPI004062BB7E
MFRLTKKEVETLGQHFAEALLTNRGISPGKLPELVKRKDWKQAEKYEKQRAATEIARQAKAVLLQNGYNAETVDKVTSKFIQPYGGRYDES